MVLRKVDVGNRLEIAEYLTDDDDDDDSDDDEAMACFRRVLLGSVAADTLFCVRQDDRHGQLISNLTLLVRSQHVIFLSKQFHRLSVQ